MSDYASIVERTRRAFASVSKLERALQGSPENAAIQINLAASRKLARQNQERLYQIAEMQHVEVCNYKLLPEATDKYRVLFVSKSLLEYQNLFSQIHDAKRNGPKQRTSIGKDAFTESMLDFAYTYSGSLGVVLLAQSDRDFFDGNLDPSIDALFTVMEIRDNKSVREVAMSLGNAVVKRVHDWSKANVDGGFAADVRWNRSDGRQLGEVIERDRMERIIEIIEATSDVTSNVLSAQGFLIGGDLSSRSFHFVVPDGDDFRGKLSDEFPSDTEMTLGKRYSASLMETTKLIYSTEKIERRVELLLLNEMPKEA